MTDYALSKQDILRYFNNRIKVVLYDELKNYHSVHDLLKPYNRVCILYYWKKYSGHWVCCFMNKNKRVEIFDSFGTWIDDTLQQINMDFRRDTNQDFKYLTKILYNGNNSVEYNDVTLQNKKAMTCGRWCLYRMKRNDLNIEQFVDLFKNIKNKDKKIISLTNNI